jgi:hypothetical protein
MYKLQSTIQVNGNVNQLFKSYFHSQSVVQLELLDAEKKRKKDVDDCSNIEYEMHLKCVVYQS